MKLNENKCHLLITGQKYESNREKSGEAKTWESIKQKLLGMPIGKKLSFDEHISNLYKMGGNKLPVLAKLSSY